MAGRTNHKKSDKRPPNGSELFARTSGFDLLRLVSHFLHWRADIFGQDELVLFSDTMLSVFPSCVYQSLCVRVCVTIRLFLSLSLSLSLSLVRELANRTKATTYPARLSQRTWEVRISVRLRSRLIIRYGPGSFDCSAL